MKGTGWRCCPEATVIKADPRDTGDEPYLLAQKLPGIPIIISKKRFLAGLFAHERFGTNFFVLDDGFQHLGLRRDLDLVLIDASSPFGNGHLLPWGPLREPIDELARADATILTRFSGQTSGEKTLKFINLRFPKIPAFCADHLPEKIVFPFLSEVCEPDFLKGKRVLAFAGIARPDAFKETLLKLGAEIAHFRSFSDHYQFNRSEIEALIEMKDSLGARYILTSEKDWVRMASITPSCPQIAYLSIKFVLISDQGGFYSLVRSAVNLRCLGMKGN